MIRVCGIQPVYGVLYGSMYDREDIYIRHCRGGLTDGRRCLPPPGVPFTSYYVYGVSKDHDANKIGMHPFSPDMHDACLSLFGREDPGQQSLI